MVRASERACNGLVTSGDQVTAVRAAAAQAPGRVEGPGV